MLLSSCVDGTKNNVARGEAWRKAKLAVFTAGDRTPCQTRGLNCLAMVELGSLQGEVSSSEGTVCSTSMLYHQSS